MKKLLINILTFERNLTVWNASKDCYFDRQEHTKCLIRMTKSSRVILFCKKFLDIEEHSLEHSLFLTLLKFSDVDQCIIDLEIKIL